MHCVRVRGSSWWATRPVDTHDVGAEVGKQHCRERAWTDPADLHDADARERTHVQERPGNTQFASPTRAPRQQGMPGGQARPSTIGVTRRIWALTFRTRLNINCPS
jgi:hypothetical protein